MTSKNEYTIELSKTLYQNMYRAKIINIEQETIGFLRIITSLPLDRALVPKNAPTVPFFLLVIVDDADINKDTLLDFEEKTSLALLKRFKTAQMMPEHCEFYYPSPAFNFGLDDKKNSTSL